MIVFFQLTFVLEKKKQLENIQSKIEILIFQCLNFLQDPIFFHSGDSVDFNWHIY